MLFGAGFPPSQPWARWAHWLRGCNLAQLHGFTSPAQYRATTSPTRLNPIQQHQRRHPAVGCRQRVTYRHGDLEQLEDRLQAAAPTAKIIVTDGVFSQTAISHRCRGCCSWPSATTPMVYASTTRTGSALHPGYRRGRALRPAAATA